MKIIFEIDSAQFVLNDANDTDLKALLKIRAVKNRWRKEHEPLELGGRIKDINFFDDDAKEIIGLTKEVDILERIKTLEDENSRYQRYWSDERVKTQELEIKLKVLKGETTLEVVK